MTGAAGRGIVRWGIDGKRVCGGIDEPGASVEAAHAALRVRAWY
jgi:hypothetical protein